MPCLHMGPFGQGTARVSKFNPMRNLSFGAAIAKTNPRFLVDVVATFIFLGSRLSTSVSVFLVGVFRPMRIRSKRLCVANFTTTYLDGVIKFHKVPIFARPMRYGETATKVGLRALLSQHWLISRISRPTLSSGEPRSHALSIFSPNACRHPSPALKRLRLAAFIEKGPAATKEDSGARKAGRCRPARGEG